MNNNFVINTILVSNNLNEIIILDTNLTLSYFTYGDVISHVTKILNVLLT